MKMMFFRSLMLPYLSYLEVRGSQVTLAYKLSFDFRGSQACRDAIAGRFSVENTAAGRVFHLQEGLQLLQRQHNDLVHDANSAVYRVQQSWHGLCEAYQALLNVSNWLSNGLYLRRTGLE